MVAFCRTCWRQTLYAATSLRRGRAKFYIQPPHHFPLCFRRAAGDNSCTSPTLAKIEFAAEKGEGYLVVLSLYNTIPQNLDFQAQVEQEGNMPDDVTATCLLKDSEVCPSLHTCTWGPNV